MMPSEVRNLGRDDNDIMVHLGSFRQPPSRAALS